MWYLPAAHATIVEIANSHDLAGRVNPADDLTRKIVKFVFLAQSPH
jgi:hypothetical protein